MTRRKAILTSPPRNPRGSAGALSAAQSVPTPTCGQSQAQADRRSPSSIHYLVIDRKDWLPYRQSPDIFYRYVACTVFPGLPYPAHYGPTVRECKSWSGAVRVASRLNDAAELVK